MELKRTNYSSGAPLEEKVGYSRMVKVGPFIYIGGTTSVQPDGSIYGEGSAYEQTKYVLEKHVELLEKAGSKKEEVIKVKVYATDMKFVPDIAKAYSEIFKEVKPLCTVVGTPMLNRPTQLVEIEMDAVIGAIAE
ncbi:Rid family hydrolase [Acetobacterium bakii]|uniref:Endoribonuclease L-PSP n=1 Tax=Acetobacterium bakii TaxID=52689 RepID=A0A0L6U508_9FIRM|nr:Rid family hydrolase [Acetobacterium bakii]KNZ43402.1 endoribonuclease L-PSP [Acetobacterium bakii]